MTRADKNAIIRAPPPEIEDDLCRQHCGMDLATLWAKAVRAMDDPDAPALNRIESEILAKGAHLGTYEDMEIENKKIDEMPGNTAEANVRCCPPSHH